MSLEFVLSWSTSFIPSISFRLLPAVIIMYSSPLFTGSTCFIPFTPFMNAFFIFSFCLYTSPNCFSLLFIFIDTPVSVFLMFAPFTSFFLRIWVLEIFLYTLSAEIKEPGYLSGGIVLIF